ncbi:cytosolic sulfotransferase 5 [Setaria viridis]
MTTGKTNQPAGAIGPEPFMKSAEAVPVIPVVGLTTDPKLWVCFYQGTWVLATLVPGIVSIQRNFAPRRGDVVLASIPKSGTTWLKALAFATMARAAHPPADNPGHPLLRLNPHQCVPYMERMFAAGDEAVMDTLPSPRLMSTHLHHSILPTSITNNPDCKIIYICRDPKDMLVSFWHFVRRINADISFSDVFEAACNGTSVSGPIWDHLLGYWNASKASPETVLFLRYEEMLRDPAGNARKLARFVGQPFSPAEEEAGVVDQIVRLCSIDKLKSVEVNKGGSGTAGTHFANDWYFRKGGAGDWANHMTPDMARRLDAIVEEKLSGSGLSFARD